MEVDEEMGFCSLEGNFTLLLRADLLLLILSCLEAIDPISVLLRSSSMFTILNWLEMFSSTCSNTIYGRRFMRKVYRSSVWALRINQYLVDFNL